MHELSIALGIIDIATEEAERRGATLAAVHIKVGALSGVVPRALEAAYELAREGTPAAESQLVIEECPVVVRCGRCGVEAEVASIQLLEWSRCGAPAAQVISGRELEVVALELGESAAETCELES
jgi:hydrogenase nickel incorporation protein HypA/HybF